MGNTRYTRAVEQAARMCGGYADLAKRIGVKLEEVTNWASGAAEPPPAAFVAVTDILLGDSIKLARKTLLTGRHSS